MTSDREKLGETNPRSWTSCGLCSGYNVAFGIGIPLLYGLSKPERHITAIATLPVECGRPHSTGENPPYGMIGGVEETSASFEARSAPRSYRRNWFTEEF